MPNNTSAYRLDNIRETLKLLEGHLEKNYEDANQLEDKAKTIIGGAGLLAGLIAGFQPLKVGPVIDFSFQNVLLAAGFTTFVATVYHAILVLSPQKYSRPVKAEWETVVSYWHLSDYDLLARLTSAYIAAIEANLTVLQRKSRYLVYSASGFVASILILILLVVLTP